MAGPVFFSDEIARQKDGPGQLWVIVLALRYKPGSRGDGRHWPGPDVRVLYFELFATKQSPRRVQTDAYHRPCVLNYHPYTFTSFKNSR